MNYQGFVNKHKKLRGDMLNAIEKKVKENGGNYPLGEDEFFENGIEDGDMVITEIADYDGFLAYKRRNWLDYTDWLYVSELTTEDLLYIVFVMEK
jgi:hypothetical protein